MFDFSVETPYRRFESKLASNMSMLWRILPHIAIIIAIYIPTLTLQSHTGNQLFKLKHMLDYKMYLLNLMI